MSDYHTETGILRGQMANMLAENTEQFAFVISNALSQVTADDVIETGQLGDEADPDLVIFNLRKIADAIERGSLR